MDRLEKIKKNIERGYVVDPVEIHWMAGEIKTLRQAAHIDQAVIQRLRQERLAAINEADAYREERDEFRAKLARTKQLAVSLTERPMR